MPSFSFRFINTNDGQDFQVDDEIDQTHNPIWVGHINHNDPSPNIQCWVGDDGKGRVTVTGSISTPLTQDILDDGQEFNY